MNGQWHRRDFLKSGSALAAAVLTGTGAIADEPKPKKRSLKKAVMYATIGFKGTVLEKLQALNAAGFEGVEPMSHMNQDEVMEALEKTGLKAASVCCSSHWTKPLSDPREKVRKEGLEGLLQALKDAQRYGATSVLLVPGVVNKEVSYHVCFQRCVAEIRKAIPQAKDL